MVFADYFRNFLLFSVLYLSAVFQSVAANFDTISAYNRLDKLVFTPMSGHGDLMTAKDDSGNTWVKGELPSDFLNNPIILYIPTIHIVDYDLYIHEEGCFVQVFKNISSN